MMIIAVYPILRCGEKYTGNFCEIKYNTYSRISVIRIYIYVYIENDILYIFKLKRKL